MRVLDVVELLPGDKAATDLYHQSGAILIARGDTLRKEHLNALQQSGILRVFSVETKEDLQEFRRSVVNREVETARIASGEQLPQPVYDKDSRLLLQANVPITEGIRESFLRRGFKTIYVRRDEAERRSDQVETFQHFLEEKLHSVEMKPVSTMLPLDRMILDPRLEMRVEKLDQAGRSMLEQLPEGPPLQEAIKKHDTHYIREKETKELYVGVYDTALADARRLFQLLKDNKTVEGHQVGEMARRIIRALLEDKDLLNNLVNAPRHTEYMVHHSMNVAMIAINIATALRFGDEQVLEVAYGAFLADVGMLRIGEEVLDKTSELTLQEKLQIQKHTLYSLDMLQQFRNIPVSTPYVAYQSHERIDGSGYPKQRPGPMIHTYARIVAVADTYDALTKRRAFRPALHPYQAMEQVIRLGGSKKLDVPAIRGLLTYFSLFPVGSWVALNDGKIARVVAPNADAIDRPVVHLYDPTKIIDPKVLRIDLKKNLDLKVARVVEPPAQEKDIMSGF